MITKLLPKISATAFKINHITNLKPFEQFNLGTSAEKKLYSDFIICIVSAIFNASPHKKIIDESLSEILKNTSRSGKISENCKFLFRKIVRLVDVRNDSIENALLKSLEQMNDLLELSQMFKVEKAQVEISGSFKTWLLTVSSVLTVVNDREKVLTNHFLAAKLLKFYLKLYKMFQKKTHVEEGKDMYAFELILLTFELLMFDFVIDKTFLVKSLINYWPTSKKFQVETIKTFKLVCDNLKSEEIKKVENVLLKKLNEIFLNSNSLIFHHALKSFEDSQIESFWLSKCSEDQQQLFRSREIEDFDEEINKKESSKRRKNKLNLMNK